MVPLFPLIGFLITGLGRNVLGKLAGWIASVAVFASFCISVGIFLQLKGEAEEASSHIVHVYNFITAKTISIDFAFQIDRLSSLFLLIITGIGFLIHIYSISYMKDDDGFAKFFSYLNLFVFSMLLLVMGSNYIIMFIGWEGVGLCSYLLIGFWYKNIEFTKAARKAFVMNRIGDVGVLIGMFLLFSNFHSLNFKDIESALHQNHGANTALLTAIAMCLFLGACGKSAQLPLFTWLPDAMAGPTPVSALIHAATMVTAGIYMIARSHFIYSLTPTAQQCILLVGLATALVAATIATVQNDIKKVLAYSTVSQLGFMFMALGVGAYTAAVFHVITHAFFKSLLFLGSGSVIHGMGGEQDIRKMGGLHKHMKITSITFLIGCIAIAGIPPLSGFFSKDEIMMNVFTEGGKIYWIFGMIAALMTAFYMFRLYFVTFSGKFRGTHDQEHHLHESPALITIPLVILSILSIVGGFIGIPEVFGHEHALKEWLEPVLESSYAAKPMIHALSHNNELMLMGVATMIAILGILMGYFYYKKYNASSTNKGIAKVFEDKWYFDEAYDKIAVEPILNASSFTEKNIERKTIDGAVNGVGKLIDGAANKFRFLQNGLVGFYMFMMVIGIVLLFALQLFLK
jgi:NADH-quinone oxidoreductase subunit L